MILLKLWKPSDSFSLAGEHHTETTVRHHSGRELMLAWGPYALLVIFVLLWGYKPTQQYLNIVSIAFHWPGLHNTIERMPPAVAKPMPYGAPYNFNWL